MLACGIDGVYVEVEPELLVDLVLVDADEAADVVRVHFEEMRAEIGGAREREHADEAAEGSQAGVLLLVAILGRLLEKGHAACRARILGSVLLCWRRLR